MVLRTLIHFCLLLLLSANASSASLSGFASLGVGKTNRSDGQFIDYDDNWSGRSDSLLGVQLNQPLYHNLDLTLQLLSQAIEVNDRSEFQPSVDWLFASYQISPAVRFRIGRLRTPLFLNSDNLAVGYSYDWARPPVDVYAPSIIGLSNFDGFDISMLKAVGDREIEVAFYLGRTKKEIMQEFIDIDVMTGAHFELKGDFDLFRYSFMAAKTTQYSDATDQAAASFRQFNGINSIFDAIADEGRINNEWYFYQALGAEWEGAKWTISTEANITIPPETGPGSYIRGGYIALTMQLDNLRPYIVIGHHDYELNERAIDAIRESTLQVPENIIPSLDALRQLALTAYENYDYHGLSGTIGLRFDLLTNIALKAEFQYFNAGTHLSDEGNVSGDIQRQRDHHLTTIILEVIF